MLYDLIRLLVIAAAIGFVGLLFYMLRYFILRYFRIDEARRNEQRIIELLEELNSRR